MKKRVLQIIGSFHQGGSERQAVSLTRNLVEDGTLELFVATLNKEGSLLDHISSIDLPEIPEFPLTSFFNANFVRQVRRCAKYIHDNSIDIVHTHDFYTNIFGMAAASLAGVSARIASKRETGGMRTKAQNLVEKAAFRRAKLVIANSEAVKEHLFLNGVQSDKVRVIYNGLDISRFDVKGKSSDFGLPSGKKFATIVANLRHDVKNIPMLLRSASMTKELEELHYVVAGEGELRQSYEAMAVDLGVEERVHFLGRCDDIPALLAASNFGVLTSFNEGFSNSILEYMASGLPVVATNVGGAREVIENGKNGFLIESDDAEALAKRLVELVNDPDKATEFGSRGKSLVREKFSLQSQLQRTIKLYHEVVAA